MLTRFDPFRDFDRVFERPWGPRRQPTMPLDAYRHGETYVVNVDLPGFDPESIDVSVEKDVLSIRAERRWTPTEGDDVVAAERTHGEYFRQLFLGDGLDTDKIHATYDNGVLTVTIPMTERSKPRRIEINQNGGGQRVIDAASS
jgi:HSP20 family protein